MSRLPRRTALGAAALAGLAGLLGGCAGTGTATAGGGAGGGEVTVTNCGQEVTLPSPAQRIHVNDANMTAMLLALGAADQIAGVSGLGGSTQTLAAVYGEQTVADLPVVTPEYPSMENVIATRPDVVVAGWNYGYSHEKNLTPESLTAHGIAPYVLSESCRRADGARGTMPPWEALYADLDNLGEVTGHQERARELVADTRTRLDTLEAAPQAQQTPTVFVFDGGTKDIFTSGAFGAPQAIIEAAGARNATEDVRDTWTTVSWERLAASEPDFFAFVDYPGQTYEQKVDVLRANPATRDLPAVREERFLNLPYEAWTSSPLNIDAAEQLRADLEQHALVPESRIEPHHDLRR